MAEKKFEPGMYELTLLGTEIYKQYGMTEVVDSPSELKHLEDKYIIFDIAREAAEGKNRIIARTFPKSEQSTIITVQVLGRSRKELDEHIRTAKLDNYILAVRRAE